MLLYITDVASTWETQNAYTILMGNSFQNFHLDGKEDGMITLQRN